MTTYRTPIVLTFVSVIGLLAALAVDGVLEQLAVMCTAMPLAAVAYFYVRRPRAP